MRIATGVVGGGTLEDFMDATNSVCIGLRILTGCAKGDIEKRSHE